MKSKTELRAAATARALEVIASEMGVGRSTGLLTARCRTSPRCRASRRRRALWWLERPPFDYSGRVPLRLPIVQTVRCR
jgi:hypothetical protein